MATTKKTTTKKVTTKKAKKVEEPKHIGLVRDDSWLEPFEQAALRTGYSWTPRPCAVEDRTVDA